MKSLFGAHWGRHLAALDRRVAAWRERAALQLLLHEHPGLTMGADVVLEAGLLWRLDRHALVTIGAGSRFRMQSEIKVGCDEAGHGGRLVVGQRVHVGPWVTLSVLEEIVIGDDCLIAERVSIRDHDHRHGGPPDSSRPYHARGYLTQPVRLGRNVWLGGGVTIVKGVTLGENCVVGANAVVTRSFPANSLLVGVPARAIERPYSPTVREAPHGV